MARFGLKRRISRRLSGVMHSLFNHRTVVQQNEEPPSQESLVLEPTIHRYSVLMDLSEDHLPGSLRFRDAGDRSSYWL